MFKPVCIISISILIVSGCSRSNKNNEKDTLTVRSKNNSVVDSYAADTLYQSLPNRLVNLSDSKNLRQLLAQNWVMEEDLETLRYADGDGTIVIPVRSFSMLPDFTVVKNCRNAILTGTWSFDEAAKIITFKYKDGGKDVYKLRALAMDEMKLTNIGISTESVLKFIADGKVYLNKEDDPFTVENNKWRVGPDALENDEAIRKRLKENINFFILYYKDAIARRADVVSFYGFPSCLNWYSKGIYLKNEKDIPTEWEECFYNKAQAMKAYKIMAEVMNKKYIWLKDKKANWIKQNLFVLEQMYSNL